MIFIDTGAFIARYVERDQRHLVARNAWSTLSKTTWRCFTSTHVLDETVTLLARRTSYSFAAQRARKILTSGELTILRPHHEDDLKAVDLFEKFADQQVSYTDCISFVLMRKQKIDRAFAFDRHFRLAGFTVWPAQE